MSRAIYGYPNRKPHERMPRELVGETLWHDVAWAYRDALNAEHSDMYLLVQRDRALRNFDLSLRYFGTLDRNGFEESLEHLLVKVKSLKPVERLDDWVGADGAYVMVFDGYKQLYVGQSSDIRRRIRAHWSGRKSFDRLVFGGVYRSILPVDEFRAFDNTRIFAARSRNRHWLEERAERAADPRYTLNRISGGELSPFAMMIAAAHPRGRGHVDGTEATEADLDAAYAQVDGILGDTRSPNADVVAELARLDMAVHLSRRKDGATRLWSRRDIINHAAVRGELTVPQFERFLTLVGETVVWP